MALVRISEQLITDVKSKVDNMCRSEINTKVESVYGSLTSQTSNKWADYVERMVWGAHHSLMAQMPKEWMQPVESFTLKDDDVGVVEVSRPNRQKLMLPPRVTTYGRIAHDGSEEEVKAHFALMKEKNNAINAINAKYTAIKTQLVQFLNASPSLNKALKLYPDLAFYVPQRYIEKVEQIVERSGTRAPNKEGTHLDTELLTSVAVMHAVTSSVNK